MKRILLLIAGFICFLSLMAQNTQSIDITNSKLEPSAIGYYVLDIADGRSVQTVIGMVNAPSGSGVITLKFKTKFHDQLYRLLRNAYTAGTDKIPVVLNVKKLWLSESSDETGSYSICDLDVDFLTPRNQKFYETSIHHELVLENKLESHSENIILSLFAAISELRDPGIPEKYNAVINAYNNQFPQGSEAPDLYGETAAFRKKKKSGRLAFQGGYSRRLDDVPVGINQANAEYLKKLRNGYHLGMDLNFFINLQNAFGISTSYFHSQNTLENVIITGNSGIVTSNGDITESINLTYIGPSYFRTSSNTNGTGNLIFGLTAGYYAYGEKLTLPGESMKISGGTAGIGFSLGYDFLTTESFAVGLQAGILMGWLNKIKINGESVNLDNSENLSRIDFTLGIRLYP